MTIKQLRARLDRLKRLVKLNETKAEERKLPYEFPIDPALAKAIRDDRKRLDELEKDQVELWRRQLRNEPDPPEERMLRARIAERAKTISCPAGYGFNEVWDDKMRLLMRGSEEDWPWFAHLTPLDDDAEEAQLIARIEAFNQSPEGRARARIRELEFKNWMTPAEHSELDGLLKRYPQPWCHPKEPMINAIEAWGRAARHTAEEDRLHAERINFLRRRNAAQEAEKSRAKETKKS